MKTNLQCFFIGLALLAGVHPVLAQVTNLGIAPVAGGQSLLYWPVSTTNYVLQTVTNLIHTNQAQYTYSTNFSYDLGPTNSPSGTSPAGSFDVNGYGLYDMAGNVFEWCWDVYGSPYGQPSSTNPTGPVFVGCNDDVRVS